MNVVLDWFADHFSQLHAWVFESSVQPLAYALGMGGWLEVAYGGTMWLLLGLLQLLVIACVLVPMQKFKPVEPVTDRATIRTDILYTCIHRLGLFRLAMFFSIAPLMDDAWGWMRVMGWPTWHLDDLWPGVTDVAWVSLLMYLVVFDFVDYWIHRGQHQFNWWWGLHSLHHSQRQMTVWSDNRNHLLDDLIRDVILVCVGQLIGVAPAQFVAIVFITQLSESFQHANLRLWFGRVGERLWVSPRFHRLHHAIGLGHESPGHVLGGHNFGVLLPWWDMLFGTANFEKRFDATGVRDQVEQGRDYGRGFWQQQWLGLKRLGGRA
jgi:sterol desaturase/sphingolipid hydroxylase (fatty acid hydroxylase superfamily)